MKDKKNLLKDLNEAVKTMAAMHKAVKLNKYQRMKIPSVLRSKMYRKLVVPALKQYNNWLEQEVIKRTKTKK